MNRPAMLLDIMYPLLSVLEANRDAPMREIIGWELQLADDGTDANLRESYADRLQELGCDKREADVRKEAATIRAGGTVNPRRFSPPLVIHYPPGVSNVGTDDSPVYRDNLDLVRELTDGVRNGAGVIAFENTVNPDTGRYEWGIRGIDGTPMGTFTNDE